MEGEDIQRDMRETAVDIDVTNEEGGESGQCDDIGILVEGDNPGQHWKLVQ